MAIGKNQRSILRSVKEIETQANRGNLLLFSAQLKIIETWLRELEDHCDEVVKAREEANEVLQPKVEEEPVPAAEVAAVQQPDKKRKRNTKKSTSGPGKA